MFTAFNPGPLRTNPCSWLPSEVPRSPLTSSVRVSLLRANFSSFMTPFPGQTPSWNPLSHFSSLFFALPHSKKIGLHFWDLPPAFRSCSVGIACRWFFDVFVRKKVFSLSYSSAILCHLSQMVTFHFLNSVLQQWFPSFCLPDHLFILLP